MDLDSERSLNQLTREVRRALEEHKNKTQPTHYGNNQTTIRVFDILEEQFLFNNLPNPTIDEKVKNKGEYGTDQKTEKPSKQPLTDQLTPHNQ